MTDLRLRHPHSVLAARIGVDAATVAIEALWRAGWHLVSDAVVTRREDGTQTRVQAGLDGEVVAATGRLSQYLAAAAPIGYTEHADAELGRDFLAILAILGHRLGVPGCENIPERLQETGHP